MAQNFMGPSQMMGQQLSGALQAASESAANQRAAIAAQQMEQQKMAREMEVNFDMYKLMSGVDNVSAFQFLNKGLSYIGRSVEIGNEERVYRIFEEANKRKQAGDLQGMGDLLKKADLFMVKTADRDRAREMRAEAEKDHAAQLAGSVVDLQPKDPGVARAETLLQYQDMLQKGMPSPGDVEKLTALTGSSNPQDWRAQMVIAGTVVDGQKAYKQALANLYRQSPDAFTATAKELGKTQGDWQAMGLGRLSNLLLKTNRTPDEEQEVLAKAAVLSPQLFNLLTTQSAQTQLERRQAALAQVRNRQAEIGGYLDVLLGQKSQVAGLESQTDGLPSPDQPLPDKDAVPHILAMGTLENELQLFQEQTAPHVQRLERDIAQGRENIRQLNSLVVARPNERLQLQGEIKDQESAIAANEALVRLIRDENPKALAKRKAELTAETDMAKRLTAEQSFNDLEQRRKNDEAVVQQERARLDRQEVVLQGKMTADERRAQKEQDLRDAEKAVLNAVANEVPQPQAVKEASRAYGVEIGELSKAVSAYRGNYIAEAQSDYAAKLAAYARAHNGEMPKQGELFSMKAEIVKRTGVDMKELETVERDPNRPLANVQVYNAKQDVAEAGKIANVNQAISEIQQVRQTFINPDGSVNRAQMLAAAWGVPFTQGRNAGEFIERAVEIKLRAATGAAARPDEIKMYARIFGPSTLDSDEAIKYKLDAFENWMQTVVDTTDPTGDLRKRAQGMMSEGTIRLLGTDEYKELRAKFPQASAGDIVKFLQSRKAPK